MQRLNRGFTLMELLVVIIIIGGIGGWIANIVKLVGMDMDPITPLLIARVIGILVAPVGAILGYV